MKLFSNLLNLHIISAHTYQINVEKTHHTAIGQNLLEPEGDPGVLVVGGHLLEPGHPELAVPSHDPLYVVLRQSPAGVQFNTVLKTVLKIVPKNVRNSLTVSTYILGIF